MIFAYVIGMLSSIVTNLDQAKRQLQNTKQKKAINMIFSVKSIPSSPTSELLLRVRRNHHHFLLISDVFDERRIVDLFPPHMQTVSTGTCPSMHASLFTFILNSGKKYMGAVVYYSQKSKTRLVTLAAKLSTLLNLCTPELHFIVKGSVKCAVHNASKWPRTRFLK